MLLFALTLVLVGPAIAARFIHAIAPRRNIPWQTAAKIGITLLFLTTGIAHFIVTGPMAQMVPPPIPFKTAIIYGTGVFEIAGAIGIWVPRFAQTAGTYLVLLVIAVFPANIYTALTGVVIAGQHTDAKYLIIRVPFEILLVVWTYFATRNRAPANAGNITTS